MADISLSVAAFVTICVIIIILLILVIGLSILLYKMKSKVYKQLIEQGESTTTINGNRYNYKFHFNKESEDLLNNVSKKLNFDEPGLVTKPCSVNVTRKVEAEDQTDSISDRRHEQNAMVLPKTIYAREQIARLCTEIMSSKNPDYFRESHELEDLSNKKKSSIRKSLLDRSKSTPELDIYDVVPQRGPVLDYKNPMEEDAEYSLPRSDSKVILDIDTGYSMPISLKSKTYANATLK